MADRKAALVVFGYDDGSYAYAVGDHAKEVMEWLDSAQVMMAIHGSQYAGRKMVQVPEYPNDLEPVASIAERTFPEWVAELNGKQT